jgi:hypothetical protein
VRGLIEEKRTIELEGHVPFAVDKYIIDLWVSKWKVICMECFDDIEQEVHNLWEELCTKHFGQFRTTGLLAAVRLTPPRIFLTVAGRKSEHILMMRKEK